MNDRNVTKEVETLLGLHNRWIGSLGCGDIVGAMEAYHEVYFKSLEYISDLADNPETKVLLTENMMKMRYDLGREMAKVRAAIDYDNAWLSDDSRKKPLT